MKDSKIDNSTSYKIGFVLGNLIIKFVFLIGRILWNGVVIASGKNKWLLGLYISMATITAITQGVYGDCSIPLIITFGIAIISSIHLYIEEYPHKKRAKYFTGVFEEIKLYSFDKQTPYFLYEQTISEYAVLVAFHSFVPVSDWLIKKELLELYFNEKIIEIKQDENNNRTIQVIVQTNPLPNYMEWDNSYIDHTGNILNIGFGYYGMVGMDLEKYPHGFIAGETGSGKSNILKCLIHQALSKNYDVILIDFKRGVSFSNFSHAVTIYYDYVSAMQILKSMVQETNRRLDLFRETKVDNLIDYNRITNSYLERKIIFIDELAELLKTRDKEISAILYDSIETLTRLSRAVGIHLIMGIQRPDSTIVNGQIKNNVSYRICGRFVDKEPSRIMLGSDAASSLPNVKGRFVVKDNDIQEIQSFYYREQEQYQYNTREVEEVTDTIIYGPAYHFDVKVEEVESFEEKETPNEFHFDFSDIKRNE